MVQHFNTKIVTTLVYLHQVSARPDQHELAFLWSYQCDVGMRVSGFSDLAMPQTLFDTSEEKNDY